jgi:hypothetical protein
MTSQIISKECAYMRTRDGQLYIKDFENNDLYILSVEGTEVEDSYAYLVDEEFVDTLYQTTPILYLEGSEISPTHPDRVCRIIRPMIWVGDEECKPNQEEIMDWAMTYWTSEKSWFVPVPCDDIEDVLLEHSVKCKMFDKEIKGIEDEDN